MKLRLRSCETRETLKLEVPNSCNLQDLKEVISQNLPSLPPSSIHLSLNRKDELTNSSPEESIQSIGIASGDLIYFTTNPNSFSSDPQIAQPVAPLVPKSEQSQKTQAVKSDSLKQEETQNTTPSNTLDLDSGEVETVCSSSSNLEETSEPMEICDDEKSVYETGKSFSVPGFLRKVFTEELGGDGGLNHKLLAIAVRAVLLESGFVEFDPASISLKSDNSNHQGNWCNSAFYYTLPDINIISHDSIVQSGVINSVKIMFQKLGRFCKVYGSLVNGTGVHWVRLDEDTLVPFLNVVWANCGQVVGTMEEDNLVSSVLPERVVFEFWKEVKDGLALPLLIDLCEKAGLGLPPCFMRLPTELKLKILESLSGLDIAKVCCVCSELRYLASSEDLWKQKYVEEFGNAEAPSWGRTFKERFARSWESRKRRTPARILNFRKTRRLPVPFSSFPFDSPQVIGGNYSLPNRHQLFGLGGRRNVLFHCNLGGLDS